MKHKIILMLLCSILSAKIYAQDITFSGSVVDSDGNPLIGVTVVAEGVSNGTITDLEGNFSIKCKSGNLVRFNYIGYKEFTRKSVQGNVKVVLHEETQNLDEVVVVGYGVQKKGSVTGSITSINTKDIEEFPSANLSTVLMGRLSGVSISASTGKPGASSSFNVRAKGTPNNSDPLFVIDGVIRDKMSFDALDASEVENISVLKDGASAAIYGSRAANGVVLVTTKKGATSKPTINYTGSVSVDTPTHHEEIMSAYEFATYMNDKSWQKYLNDMYWSTNGNVKDPRKLTDWYTDDELEYFKGTNHSFYDDAWRTPWNTRHSLNISGGTEKTRYFMAGSYYTNKGSFDNLKYHKYNFRSNIEANISKNLLVGLNLSTDSRNDKKPYWPYDNDGDSMRDLYKGVLLRTNLVPSMINGKPVGNFIEWHPLMLIDESSGIHTKRWSNINTNIFLEYSVPFIKGLKTKIQYNKSVDNRLIKEVCIPYEMYIFKTTGTNGHIIAPENEIVSSKIRDDGNFIRKEYYQNENYQFNIFVTYDRIFKKHNIGAMFVYEQSEGHDELFDAKRNELISWTIPEFNGASGDANKSEVGPGKINKTGRLSYVGRINYSYDDKYLLETTIRVDGSTKFAPNQRWGIFPSLSLGWRISSEPFFKDNIKFIDYLKLRGSVATLGNDAIGGWQWMERYNITTGAVFGGLSYGLQPGEVPNLNLTWEKSTSYNIGFDSKWFNNKFNLSFEYFYRKTYDILDNLNTTTPTTYGAALPKENYSEVKSSGLEIEIGYNNRINNFNYYINGNFGLARSWWSKKDEAINIRPYKSEIGKSLNRLWGYECTGIIRTEEQLNEILKENPNMTILGEKPGLGMLMYNDLRGPNSDEPDGIITTDDQIVVCENTTPPINYGFALGGRWKGFSFEVFFQGMAGFEKCLDFRGNKIGGMETGFKYFADHWTPENTDASMPGGAYKNNIKQVSTFWKRNASFLRCKNISLAYEIPNIVSNKVGLKKMKVFLNGTNLFLLQNDLRWMDPESNSQCDYPLMRTFTLGLNLTL